MSDGYGNNSSTCSNGVTRTASVITRSALNIESDGEQQHVSLVGDEFPLMIVSKAGTSPWLVGFGIFALQMALLVSLCVICFLSILIMLRFMYFIKGGCLEHPGTSRCSEILNS